MCGCVCARARACVRACVRVCVCVLAEDNESLVAVVQWNFIYGTYITYPLFKFKGSLKKKKLKLDDAEM